MKITVNYATTEALTVIDILKATVDMYEGFGMDNANQIREELDEVFDKIVDGTWNSCMDSPYAGIKVDGKAKTIELVIDEEVFRNNMNLATMILKKAKPIVNMIKSICEVAHDAVTSIKEVVKKATVESLKRGETMDKSYMVKVIDVQGYKATAMARVTRWDTVEVVEATLNADTPELIREVILDEVVNYPNAEDWANRDLMNLVDAREQYKALSGTKSHYQIGDQADIDEF